MVKESLSEGGEIVLFGVRVKVDPMRKSVSMNNLCEYDIVKNDFKNEAVKVDDSCYASADDVVGAGRCIKERKRGVPWTEEEHKLFLLGLQKVGKGDWRGISRNFVKTRTPTQVASHSQKYFLRRNNLNRRRRRSSLFDITTDNVSGMPMEEYNDQEYNLAQQVTTPVSISAPETPNMASNVTAFRATPFPVDFGQMMLPTMAFGKVDQSNNVLRPVPFPISTSSPNVDLNMNQRLGMESTQLSLGLSLSSGQSSSTRQSTFQLMTSFSNGENIISVA
ncbi:DNA-binding transcription factor [Lithospermum erythrorhizon]|uniref:DNA-binding transcription factor n=1 Tax=Lithospermum erythrorhizon TaxID=34254 RepID=A0AAV3RZN6_LITER